MLDILIRLPQRAMIRIKSQRRQRPLPPSPGERGYVDENDGASGWKRIDALLKRGQSILENIHNHNEPTYQTHQILRIEALGSFSCQTQSGRYSSTNLVNQNCTKIIEFQCFFES
jgi:hypothetical protein